MNAAERVSGSLRCSPPTNTPADGAGIEASVTLGELVEAVGSVTEDVTELVAVVTHVLRTRRATCVGPSWAGKRVAVAPGTAPGPYDSEPWPINGAEARA